MTDTANHPLAPMVRKLKLRSPLGDAETEALLGLPHRISSSDPAAYLLREGDKGDSCVLILSGFVYRSKMAVDGARQILSFHMAGDLVDLHNSLLEVADHSVQAMTRVEVAYIPQQAILAVAEAFPMVARALWRDTLVDGSIFREWILNVGRRNARQRLSHLLCEIALRQEEAGLGEAPHYELPMTQEQLGDATGLTPVHINRTIQKLKSEGLISVTPKRMVIEDWHGLQAAAGFSRAYLHQKLQSEA